MTARNARLRRIGLALEGVTLVWNVVRSPAIAAYAIREAVEILRPRAMRPR